MRVLQINSVCGLGSTGRIATDIHNILIAKGHESYIAYGRDEPKNCSSTIKIGKNFDTYAHVVISKSFDKHGFGSKKATMEFIKKVEELNPDIIHLHNIHGYYINIELLFKYLKFANKPVIWTLHDCWAFTGHCAYFDYANCNKWEKECQSCPQIKNYPTSFGIDNSKNNFMNKMEIFNGVNDLTIVSPSMWLEKIVKKSFLSEYPVKVINNGIDLEVFRPSENTFRENYELKDKFIILGVASIWGKRKGFQYFIELSKHLKQDEVIVLVGLKKKQIRDLPSNIIGITRTNRTSELAEIYSSADVFVNPTLEDNFPTTNLESLACGVPVITFNTGGSPESIDGTCGFVVEKGNTDGLLRMISKVKENGKSSYAKKCEERAINLFNKDNKFNEYIQLYISCKK